MLRFLAGILLSCAMLDSAVAQQPQGNFVFGSGNATNTAATTIIASPGASLRIYVTGVQCGRTDAGTTAIFVTLNDDKSTILVLPNSGGGGGNNIAFGDGRITVARGTALTLTASSGVSTLYCNAQGYAAN
jgi:hypothetical protein